eukprot:symbB.v1.2.012352.t1/scaffold854.1/size229663/6
MVRDGCRRSEAKGVLEVPNQLRRQVMQLFEVSTRLLQFDGPVEAGENLQKLFDQHPKLRDAFSPTVWMAEDGKSLKPEFLPSKRGNEQGGKEGKRCKTELKLLFEQTNNIDQYIIIYF